MAGMSRRLFVREERCSSICAWAAHGCMSATLAVAPRRLLFFLALQSARDRGWPALSSTRLSRRSRLDPSFERAVPAHDPRPCAAHGDAHRTEWGLLIDARRLGCSLALAR